MRIVFSELKNTEIPGFKGGDGSVEARMFYDGKVRIMESHIRPHSSIGVHTHEKNCEVMFFTAGRGIAICDGVEEQISAGVCHYCPKGSTHTVVNTGDDDLVMYCAVTELEQ